MVKFINPIGIDPSLDGNALSLSETNMLRAWQENKDRELNPYYFICYQSFCKTVLMNYYCISPYKDH